MVILSIPLVIVLFSVALMPLIAPKFWRKSEDITFLVISVFSIASVCTMLPEAGTVIKCALIDDYLPFIIMLFTLYVLGHGIHIRLKAPSSTLTNASFLACGSILASFIGTTGASMLLLRPFLAINKDRLSKVHLIIFFIFLIANIGGLLTPLGDPPLLLGYLSGVDFSWELRNITFYWLSYVIVCITIFSIVDKIMTQRACHKSVKHRVSIKVRGLPHIVLIVATVFILFFNFEHDFTLKLPYICHCIVPHICLKNAILLGFCVISFCLQRKQRESVDLEAFKEVSKIFLVIFIVIAPVIFMLNQNSDLIHRYIVNTSNGTDGAPIYFWLCAAASSFLDNAPSYLLFFNMAGGDAGELMYTYPNILKAISISAVVMGSMTYIGNAPNIMVKSMAAKNGIQMPSFLGYMTWSCLVILPISFFVALALK
jgi:Na+/H+ antiporter NhaD/arsenite permease-like protein